ncbi:hypothetical protein [Sinosporangium siamense]|uniref:Uncharacterized protein n=1 Tax=Sinosporangium siamense TaxID=1367973 RepID=A0A919REP1_9ACTN|nr:hypothetical protein [Sinosporangium siamense]GII92243.1 hypothetical protein Ssi02_24740 [Sinosporangium siamense]
MGELREMTAQWIRLLTVTGDKSLSRQEQIDLIHEVNGPIVLDVPIGRYRSAWDQAIADEVLDAAGTAALAMLNWRVNAARLCTDHLVKRLSEATGESREQILQEMALTLDAAIVAAEEELDGFD